MALNITKEVANMERLSVAALCERYREVFGEDTKARNKQWLIKRIAWKLQANEEGDISERARKLAMEIAQSSDIRTSAPKIRTRQSSCLALFVVVREDHNPPIDVNASLGKRFFDGLGVVPEGLKRNQSSHRRKGNLVRSYRIRQVLCMEDAMFTQKQQQKIAITSVVARIAYQPEFPALVGIPTSSRVQFEQEYQTRWTLCLVTNLGKCLQNTTARASLASICVPILMIVPTVGHTEQCSCCLTRFCKLRFEVMENPLFVALLIVNLLTCPLRCLACEMHATSSAVSSCATCECCKHCEEAPVSSPAPSPENDECGCKSCICDGAVVESPVELPDPGPALIWMLPLYLESRLHIVVSEIADTAEAMHVGQILSGRGARIAYQSWQI